MILETNLCTRGHFDMDTDFEAILGARVQGDLSAVTAADTADPFDPIVGRSDAVRAVIGAARRVAKCSVPVLIGGETGSGKTLLAAAIHNASARRGRPFIAQNCGSLQETLCESELFGHKRGAFSSAVQDKKGLVEAADGGTLFLDEVSEMSSALQVKLLQVLQDGSFRRVGDTQYRHVDLRLISATNKDLQREVERGNFRADLYYRLNTFPITMPALRECRRDIPVLAEHFLAKHRQGINDSIIALNGETVASLCAYDFPGNIRELENLVIRALVVTDGSEIMPGSWLPKTVRPRYQEPLVRLDSLERETILKTLEARDGNLDSVAKDLGISRTTLWRRMKGYRIPDNSHAAALGN